MFKKPAHRLSGFFCRFGGRNIRVIARGKLPGNRSEGQYTLG
jgi:hypothetical protein